MSFIKKIIFVKFSISMFIRHKKNGPVSGAVFACY